MSGKLRIPRTTIRFRDERGIVLVSLDDLLLWLAECELANDEAAIKQFSGALRRELKKVGAA